jgi:hypothetical protein
MAECLRYVTARPGGRYYWQRKGYKLRRLPADAVMRSRIAGELNAAADFHDGSLRAARTVPLDTYWPAALQQARHNARSNGFLFTLTLADVTAMAERADGKCELTGLPFDVYRASPRVRRPFSPSIDRIDCTRGYELANCRLVCLAVNIALADWGEDVLLAIAAGLVRSGRVPLHSLNENRKKSNVDFDRPNAHRNFLKLINELAEERNAQN